jgi:Tfp pilus assembly protein PilO
MGLLARGKTDYPGGSVMNFNWSALTKKQQQIAIGVTVLAVLQIVVLGYFTLKNPGESAGSAREKLSDLQKELSSAQNIISRGLHVSKQLEESVENLENMTVYAPAVFDRYAWAYEYVSRRSALAGVMIDGLQEEMVSTKGNNADAQPYEVSISMRCGYNELVRFLWYLEEGNPLIVIKELTIDSSAGDVEKHNVRIVVQWPPPFKIEKMDG